MYTSPINGRYQPNTNQAQYKNNNNNYNNNKNYQQHENSVDREPAYNSNFFSGQSPQTQNNLQNQPKSISKVRGPYSQSNIPFETGEPVQLTVNPRIIYLRKLYLALFFQHVLIGLFAYWVHVSADLRDHLKSHVAYFYLGLIGTIIIAVYACCYRQSIRKSPMNTTCLILWTICFGFTLVYGFSVAKESIIGLMVFVLLSALVLSQLIYTLTVRYELTYQGSTLFVFGAQLLVFHVFTIYSTITFFAMVVIAFFGFIFAFFFIFDTQSRIAGPDYEFNMEEWKSGAVLVYMDVFLLALKIGDLLKTMLSRQAD